MNTKQLGNLSYTKTDDLKGRDRIVDKMDLSPFVGTWTNTKEDSGQLPYVKLREEEGRIFLNAFGADERGMVDWGEVECDVFAENIYDGTSIAFITRYTFDKIDVEITANVKLGILVVQTYTKFKDGSDRLNYYGREFYGPTQS